MIALSRAAVGGAHANRQYRHRRGVVKQFGGVHVHDNLLAAVVATERFLADRWRPLVEQLGVGVMTLVVVEPRQVEERCPTSG
jgi:hypothetical protein